MSGVYRNATAFRHALEDRLRTAATKRGVVVNDLRQKLVMERLLARLFMAPDAPWLLKGGYAMELRYRPNARTTRDLDLAVSADGRRTSERLSEFRDRLQEAAATDTGDYLVFHIGTPREELLDRPRGGLRFPIVAMLAGKAYARFHIDAGFNDVVLGEPEVLTGEDFFAFAGLSPARAVAIPRHQQFAEKVHALTYPWTDRTNTRVKDLVDLVMLVERGSLDPRSLRAAIDATFTTRKTHDVPKRLPDVPESWKVEYAALARGAGLTVMDADAAVATLRRFWDGLGIPG